VPGGVLRDSRTYGLSPRKSAGAFEGISDPPKVQIQVTGATASSPAIFGLQVRLPPRKTFSHCKNFHAKTFIFSTGHSPDYTCSP